ncbi:hypothetical protein ON010_g17352 [Phytophthora cinnamomi]|nr:hypothetical protein ON010_g17352 [Phytophthora cinnamomi]
MFLPNGPQPPQVSYPFVMQDFDGIVVPLPSYLEGQERIEFRSRIYQKVLDFISEECILRFGAKADSTLVDAATTASAGTTPTAHTSITGEAQVNTEAAIAASSLGGRHEDTGDLDSHSQDAVEEARTTGIASKKVH